MTKILVNTADNEQQIFEIGQGGGYGDTSKVIWDERDDGPLPQIAKDNLGGIKRIGKDLSVDSAMLSIAQSAKAIKDSSEASDIKKKSDRTTRLESYVDIISGMDDTQLKTCVEDLLQYVLRK